MATFVIKGKDNSKKIKAKIPQGRSHDFSGFVSHSYFSGWHMHHKCGRNEMLLNRDKYECSGTQKRCRDSFKKLSSEGWISW